MRRFDAVVVGAGPAGLSAAAELGPRCLLLDGGALAQERDRGAAEDLVSGVGGAGLFSDGKHSLYPSATELWRLPDRAVLAGAYSATVALLERYGVAAGPLPEPQAQAPAEQPPGWRAKHYPALYVSFADRLACIEALWAAAGERWAHARVAEAARAGDAIDLIVERAGAREHVRANAIIVATGRWSPRWIRPWLAPLGVRFAFQRVELGVRLETGAGHPLFAALPGVDGKLTRRDEMSEIRTFCTCRDGEVVLGAGDGIAGYSGRADGPRTGRSSVGLLVRFRDPAFAAELAPALAAAPIERALEDFSATDVFGARAGAAIDAAIARLVEYAPTLAGAGVRVYAPCIEGVGDYPCEIDDGNLAVAPGVWVAGDVIGRFRGIVAAMVSGRYAARRIRSAA